MVDLTRSEKIIAEKAVGVVLVQGADTDGQPIWAYVAVKLIDLEKFMAAQKLGNFDPEKYGVIVEAGYGVIPPQEIQEKMEVEYGFNHEKMVQLQDPDEVKKQRAAEAAAAGETEDGAEDE